MSIRVPLLVSLIVVLAMAGAGYWAWTVLPDAARIAVHWGIDGKPNGYADKNFALFVIPGATAAVSLFLAAIPFIEPRHLNLAASGKFYRTVWIGVLLVLAIAQFAIIATAMRTAIDVRSVMMGAVSVLYAVIGNFLGKTRSNFFAGVRTPWTLSSEYSWEKTHRLTGRLFVAIGIATFLVLITFGAKLALILFIPAVVASLLIALVMSYVYWTRDPDRDRKGAVAE